MGSGQKEGISAGEDYRKAGKEWAENRFSAEGMRALTHWQYGRPPNAPPAGARGSE